MVGKTLQFGNLKNSIYTLLEEVASTEKGRTIQDSKYTKMEQSEHRREGEGGQVCGTANKIIKKKENTRKKDRVAVQGSGIVALSG